MFCGICGKQIKDGAKFCPFCGAPQQGGTPEVPGKKKSPAILIAVSAVLGVMAVGAAAIFLVVAFNFGLFGHSEKEKDDDGRHLSEEEQQEKQEAEDILAGLTSQFVVNAYSSEAEQIETYKANAEEYIENGQYEEARQQMVLWQNLLDAINGENDYEMEVEQVDVSEFPKIKVYVRIQDKATKTAVKSLKMESFFVQENAGGSEYQKRDILRAVQLDNAERLNISMLADVSGSMDGQPLQEAKYVMNDFLNSVQTGAGDSVSVISFADSVYINTSFTTDINLARNAVNGLITFNMTALYDGLYVAVEQTAAQDGAKCVIAFTDGKDNISNCTPAIVTEKAQRYNIPIYIIGVGSDLSTSDLEYIANNSGGFYRNVGQISNMAEIYNAIFRQQKEMYLVEYETLQQDNDEVMRNMNLDYVDEVVAVRNEYQYVPSVYREPVVSKAKLRVNDYIIYDSDRRYVTSADLNLLTQEELRLARNEIYARKGRRFNDQYLQSYFNGKPWYHGTIAPGSFSENMFNDYERANAYFIADYERLKGYIR